MLTGPYADWFVGSVSCILGVIILVSTWTGQARVFDLAKVRWVQHQIGHTYTRFLLLLVGAALVMLGVAICAGWKIHWDEEQVSRAAIALRCDFG